MELKLRSVRMRKIRSRRSNCTFMELKLQAFIDRRGLLVSSNCTFMELKPQKRHPRLQQNKF